jgi:alpha-ribazole phosphatase/probable phosphoglycerate mutase
MVTTLYLVRHGETEGSEKRRYKGTIDVPLSRNGEEQIRRTSGFINEALKNSDTLLKAVYASDLSRALRSAEIIAGLNGDSGLKPIVVPELRERNFGLWEGMSFKDPLRFSPMGGESTLEVRDRVMDALGKILKRHDGDTIAVVAHGGVNRVIICHVTGMPLENIFRVEQDNAAVNVIEFWDEYPVVKLVNRTVE